VVDARVLKFLEPIDGRAIARSSVLLDQTLAEAFVGVGGHEMLSALARSTSRVLAISLAVTRSDGRTRAGAHARGAAAEVDWLLLALNDGAPCQSGLSGFSVKLIEQLDSGLRREQGNEVDESVVSALVVSEHYTIS